MLAFALPEWGAPFLEGKEPQLVRKLGSWLSNTLPDDTGILLTFMITDTKCWVREDGSNITQVALGQHWIRDPVVRVYSQIQSYIPSTEAQLMLSTLTQPSQGLLRHCYVIVYSNCPFSGLLIKIQGWPPGHSRFVSITEIQAQHLVPYL